MLANSEEIGDVLQRKNILKWTSAMDFGDAVRLLDVTVSRGHSLRK
jgi:hypothetical protein